MSLEAEAPDDGAALAVAEIERLKADQEFAGRWLDGDADAVRRMRELHAAAYSKPVAPEPGPDEVPAEGAHYPVENLSGVGIEPEEMGKLFDLARAEGVTAKEFSQISGHMAAALQGSGPSLDRDDCEAWLVKTHGYDEAERLVQDAQDCAQRLIAAHPALAGAFEAAGNDPQLVERLAAVQRRRTMKGKAHG